MVLRTGKVYLPRSPKSAYPGGVKTDPQEDQSVLLRNSVVAQLGALAVIDCHGTKRFKYGVDADEGWMLGVLDVAGLGLVGYASRCPSFRANRMRTVSSPRSLTRIATPTLKWRPTVHSCVCHPVGAMRSRNGRHCVMWPVGQNMRIKSGSTCREGYRLASRSRSEFFVNLSSAIRSEKRFGDG